MSHQRDYDQFFECAAEVPPHRWQSALGSVERCTDRLIRIPTGFGKTAGVFLPWLFQRVVRNNDHWPRRLVFCLPMRVLVEQTERAMQRLLRASALQSDVAVHVLMGGVEAQRWALEPDRPAVLLGTQDMLLSRALNRGYASARGMWPMEFGLMHADALWVVDEVQLMDVGLATTSQLAAFRAQDARRYPPLRPAVTWWMSATLQPSWLQTVDQRAIPTPVDRIPRAERRAGLWEVQKPFERRADVTAPAAIAQIARERHVLGTLSLVVVNRVDSAIAVFEALTATAADRGRKSKKVKSIEVSNNEPEIRLVHSRFRGAERAAWADTFLRRDAPVPAGGRIVVATQVVEAGVDISARTLLTELAPWSSLVQRFGRAARYEGQSCTVTVVGAVPDDDKGAAPYAAAPLAFAHEALARLSGIEADVSPRSLETFEEDLERDGKDFLAKLYGYEPLHVLRRRDLDDLFDTAADLSGADIDVSRYIRSGIERDVRAFWRQVDSGARMHADVAAPRRDELCPVPVEAMCDWLRKGHTAYVYDYLDGAWRRSEADRIVPGMILLLAASDGGYSTEIGWNPKSGLVLLIPLDSEAEESAVVTSRSEESDELSSGDRWKTIATHGRETSEEVERLATQLGLDANLRGILSLAARWHDVGKAHSTFQAAIGASGRGTGGAIGARTDLAKAPRDAWRRPAYPERPGFRHELASTLALFEVLRRHAPDHDALLGPHRDLLATLGHVSDPNGRAEHIDHPLASELASLTAIEFNLLAWLVCSHHGKVRCVWSNTPRDQEAHHGGIHGVCEGDELSSFTLHDASTRALAVPALRLSLAPAAMGVGPRYGASWGERVASLLRRFGPFALAYLEALIRVADVRASKLDTEDTLP